MRRRRPTLLLMRDNPTILEGVMENSVYQGILLLVVPRPLRSNLEQVYRRSLVVNNSLDGRL
jgi:hypothetical protein